MRPAVTAIYLLHLSLFVPHEAGRAVLLMRSVPGRPPSCASRPCSRLGATDVTHALFGGLSYPLTFLDRDVHLEWHVAAAPSAALYPSRTPFPRKNLIVLPALSSHALRVRKRSSSSSLEYDVPEIYRA
ncbi:hypothetical protein DFH06DRAFT_1328503 [Mycena polygramma]|nr:hypothetical protein DFH06DRAFT_1328503 [Mycena polygramma]